MRLKAFDCDSYSLRLTEIALLELPGATQHEQDRLVSLALWYLEKLERYRYPRFQEALDTFEANIGQYYILDDVRPDECQRKRRV